ncbi:MAG: phosphoketolase family protein [Candidatus Nomurabacteria bacterium]|jgi:xylulose-5-phosphate/fructose-6-phosphate phosphoketolase|nr:phosphoketolase family protein [Candidatus Nomurabacteria bacterium]
MQGRADFHHDIKKFFRAAEYLTVAQIFLQDNYLLERPLEYRDIKPRLLGHFGSTPGIIKAYAHLSALIKRTGQDMMFVLGPGHGYPGLQAALFLEGSLQKVDPKATLDVAGVEYLCKQFSWPYGYPSHSSPLTPGAILEGGELGYCLSTAYGSVLDNPDLVTACLIGDGEAETASLLAALNLGKLVSPKHNGVVLPILHLNGYKISAPTIYGRMSDKELIDLFTGFGYDPVIVNEGEEPGFDEQMAAALDKAMETIRSIKQSPEDGFFRTPFIVMRTLKGETGPKELNGEKIEGNYLSHQVILTEAKTDKNQLAMLEKWLKSYKFDELFDKQVGFGDFINAVMPEPKKRMGQSKHASQEPEKLKLPALSGDPKFRVGEPSSLAMNSVGKYLRDVFKGNPQTFRFFCPDETSSNKLDAVYEATNRAWLKPLKSWDKFMSPDGRVIEMLSENTLQGLLQGYVLTGRHGVMSSYEAFMPIVTSMVDQYSKFLAQAIKIDWRPDLPSINYVLTSTGWRQDHNGFSHQNPGFISDMLLRPNNLVNVLLPLDDNSALVATEFALSAENCINIITAGKTPEGRYLSLDQARFQLLNGGAMIFDFVSDEKPHVVLAGAGDYVSKEALAAVEIVRQEAPQVRLRFVSVSAFSYGAIGTSKIKLTKARFDDIFTLDKPIVFTFHGYPSTMKQILFNYTTPERLDIHGYNEHGSTTTPFDMQVRSETDRYHLAISIFERAAEQGIIGTEELSGLADRYAAKLAWHQDYIKQHGDDTPEIKEWTWKKPTA